LLKTRFIVNPRSGRALRALAEVKAFADRHGAEVVLTERPQHATSLARSALDGGFQMVVAVGGDGTMNEVASALVGTNGILGLVPCGSGDGLGRHLKIHGSTRHALHVLANGRPRAIDTGLADGHPFFTVAGLGFEAEIAARFNRLTSRGFLRYLSTSVGALKNWEAQRYVVTHGNERTELRAFTLAVANSDQYGNNAIIAPGATADDGKLDLCAIPALSVFNALPLAARLFAGSIDRHRHIFLRRGDRFVVEQETQSLLHTDGENWQAGKRVEFTICPAGLQIMAPV
jgi:YegS/Rv2252/BmrU family lipid kinase